MGMNIGRIVVTSQIQSPGGREVAGGNLAGIALSRLYAEQNPGDRRLGIALA
jgi:formylmethanofuran dehydrogenase subunit C